MRGEFEISAPKRQGERVERQLRLALATSDLVRLSAIQFPDNRKWPQKLETVVVYLVQDGSRYASATSSRKSVSRMTRSG